MVCAAGGIVGELTMAWSALAPNSFDCEWGFSTMSYEVSGAWGASMARRGLPHRPTARCSRSWATAPT